ncbi:hypothetical protein BP6252_00980 [Coleophoma cylindrospora]|uniref:Uncharacterized protein n=1 Tax=Coleophoma cylindrospora TaxID=1849047 RepID=A0A3D8ST56_9HELO|nr:hypothetical protein BP6252_00980 [Coleophoma cylindrospora]
MEEFDIVIVGAGVFGLPVAKTYLEVHPGARLLMLDEGQSVGGTWSQERLYDELRTNNLVGMSEFSDFPMDFETFGVAVGSHVPGAVMHKYLTAYTKHFGFFDKIRFGASVKTAEMKEDDSWVVTYDLLDTEEGERQRQEKVLAKKLVLAIGTTSKPHIPKFEGAEKFGGHFFHFKELSNRQTEMSEAENVIVIGGSKSACDVAYLNAVNGRHVDWVIRASGRGPAWLAEPYVSPAQLQFEKLATTRAMSFLIPSYASDGYWLIRKLLHDNPIGRAILRGFFGFIHSDILETGRYHAHPETKKLIPPASVIWNGTSVGIFNYPKDFFEMVRKGLVDVHIEDIDMLLDNGMRLANGTEIKADVIVCATGWENTPTLKILPAALTDKCGLSTVPPDADIVRAADQELMQKYPELRDQPPAGGKIGEREREQSSWRLYRGIAPPAFIQSHNLAYNGMNVSLRGFLVGEISALWITAFLDGKLAAVLPSEEDAAWDALLESRFYRYRSPNGLGPKYIDMVFELMPYVDQLMRDLGLNATRKRGWRELFEFYHTPDYKGVVQEWMAKTKKVA